MTIQEANHKAAEALVSSGFRIFPANSDKTPCVTSWQTRASLSLTLFSAFPDSVPALPAGANGLVIFDLDRKNGKDGVAAFAELCASIGVDPSGTLTAETPSDGRHVYYRTAEAFGNSAALLPAGVDVRGAGGYCIAPGATLPDGRAYRIVQGSLDSIAPLPDALAAFLKRKGTPETPTLPTVAPVSQNATERERQYAQAALSDEVAKLESLKKGDHRNDALNGAAKRLGEMVGAGWIDGTVVATALWEAAGQNEYRKDDGDTVALATLRSGLSAGMKEPRAPLSVTDASVTEALTAMLPVEHSANWPEPIGPDAYHGIIGEFVRLVEPHTEGDPSGILIAALVGIGTLLGRNVQQKISADVHCCNLFCVLVGDTGSGRKGTATSEIERLVNRADPRIVPHVVGGLSTGEGLVEFIRDPIEEHKPGKEPEVIDSGVSDKRLLAIESEFAQVLRMSNRQGNTLSTTIRDAWDGKRLSFIARNNKNVCAKPHISIIGNITKEELLDSMGNTDLANGMINRFLWACVRESKDLPHPTQPSEIELSNLALRIAELLYRIESYIASLRMQVGENQALITMGWTDDAAKEWTRVYRHIKKVGEGKSAKAKSRGPAMVRRIAAIYTVLNGCDAIGIPHLKAAMEVWRYCAESADYIFGQSSGNTLADRILAGLRNATNGMKASEIKRQFANKLKVEIMNHALELLLKNKQVRYEGSNPTVWYAV